MDPEFADLVPLFVEEARDRIERLATCVPQMEGDSQWSVEVKRELHTLKGAGRMLQIAPLAELCHAAEEVLHAAPPGLIPLLTRVVDELSSMVEAVSRGEEPGRDTGLLDVLLRASAPPVSSDAADTLPVGGNGSSAHAVPPQEEQEPAPAAPAPLPEPKAAVSSQSGTAKPPGLGGDIRVDTASLDAVAERATQVRIMALAGRQVVERIYELARLAEEGLHEPQPTQVLAVLATMLRRVAVELEGGQRRLIRSSEEQLEKMLGLQLQPLRGSLLSLARHARELARTLGREVEVELEGEDTRLDRRIARELDEALIHLVRNSVDHGIELPDVRESQGKPRAGRLQIRASAEGPKVRLVIADDGRGIDFDAVIKRAVNIGLVDAAGAHRMGKEEALRLLFAPGFSTRKQITDISGRGIGLDVVANVVNRVGGEVFLESEPGRGTTFRVEVPLARRGEAVMLLRVGQIRLALPSSVARRATRLAPELIVERDGRTYAVFPGSNGSLERLVPFVPLSRLYGQPAEDFQLLIEGMASGQPLALAVDDVEGEQEVLVRPITRKIATDRLLEGVALLASGEPVGVLSPAVLAQREYLRSMPSRAVAVPALRRVRILLVDDSMVTREMERRLLEDAGFHVSAASDAQEALALLGEEPFDCVVTDIEMPGMDGFELTAHLRGIEHFAQLPIIVVSTRDRPDDRLRGLKVGADAYLTKQSLDAGELVDLVRRLSGR
ncbi:MAG TPA: response regulator [Thermoanaerobaculia bacterium]|nr:response regulator [Thermoanaerobaculia bacterium]